jgi:hypothetical protein
MPRYSRVTSLALPLAVLAVAYARTLAPGVTWANDGADSGDLVTAAATLGVAHPTGYPTYLLLARLFMLIPVGDLALRATLLSATAATLAALCVALIVHELSGEGGWRAALAGGAAALALGTAPVFWAQAVVAEVYSLNALFVALILFFTLEAVTRPLVVSGRRARAQARVGGLALGNHVTILLLAAIWLIAAVARAPRELRARVLLEGMAWAGLGLLVYLYLPLRARAHPPVNWGDPQDWAGIWWVVSGQPYRALAFSLPASFVGGRVEAWAGLLLRQFGVAGIALGFAGLLYGARDARLFVGITAVVAAATSVFALAYNTGDSYAYLIPAYLVFAIWIGLGAAEALRLLAQWRAVAAVAGGVALAALLAWRAVAVMPEVDASGDRRAIMFADAVTAAAPPGALVLTSSDLDTFPLWYVHYALGARPDLAVVVDPLLGFDWYRRNLRAVYPALVVPEVDAGSWSDTLIAANPARPVCRTNAEEGAEALECGAP